MISRLTTSTVLAICVLAGVGIGAAQGATTGANPGEDIRDIHGPIAVPAGRPAWWYVAGAGAAVVAAGGAAVVARRRKRREPPHERALRALREVRAAAGSDPRTFSFAVSEIVRGYVEEAFHVRAAHRTTEELLSDLMLDDSPISAHRAAVGQFLSHCDLAKFGGWSLSHVDMADLLGSAESLVVATMPDPPRNRAHRTAVHSEGVA